MKCNPTILPTSAATGATGLPRPANVPEPIGLEHLPFFQADDPVQIRAPVEEGGARTYSYRYWLEELSPAAQEVECVVRRQIPPPPPHIDNSFEHPILIVPKDHVEEVKEALAPFCVVEEISGPLRIMGKKTLKAYPLQAFLRLKILKQDMQSKVFTDLLKDYSFLLNPKDYLDTADQQYEILSKQSGDYYDKTSPYPIEWSQRFKTYFSQTVSDDPEAGIIAIQTPLVSDPIPPNGDLKRIEENILRAILEDYPGFCLGETHPLFSPKQFLIDNMPFFREQG
ncbi:MAG: hypothetical protein KGZ30_03985, partial [Anaplasmataceae bacterium]|nr:hypothetical protein [Anaplasmataceae bacterium]